MSPTRFTTRSGFVLAVALLAARAGGVQPPKDDQPREPSTYREVSNYKSARAGIPAAELPKAKEAFAAFAKYNADYISYPRVYAAAQDFAPPPASLRTLDQILAELSRHILVPVPDAGGNAPVGPDQAAYIRELGAALDDALKNVILNNPEPVVRVNATRMLAVACRSGAAAHYPTVTEFITNPNTRPEVKYYAFQAAGNLLAAYDLNNYPSRKHSAGPKEVGALVAALKDAITKPGAILSAPGGGVPPDQLPVVRFIRRQAVHALGQVRFAERVPDGEPLYPAFTLAQVAVSDPALVPPPAEAEVAEAVIGICNMSPPRGAGTNVPAYAAAMADVVATGIVRFATVLGANPMDKSLPWRTYAARLSDALKGWQPLFDPVYNPLKPKVFGANFVPAPVAKLAAEAEARVLAPMDGAGAVDVNGLRQFRNNTLRTDKQWSRTPFAHDPKLVLPKKD